MAQQTFALMTTKGRAKEAAALASGKSINISHIAIGSGETVPSGGETKLYREVLRKAISGNGLVAGSENTAYFDIFLSATEGPFTIREAGLLDDAGDLIAIAYYDPPINKPVPTSGQTVEGIIRIEVAFSNIANITIKVDPSLNVPLQRLTTTPWVPVKAIDIATPPTNPNIGDSYIIGSNSTGVWAAQEGNLTEFTQAGWAIIATPDGHGVGLPDGRVFTKVNGQYIELLASQNYVANYRIPSRQLLNPPFVAAKAIDISAPPAQLAVGDTYLVPMNASGLWAGKVGQLAEWNGSNWLFTFTPNGHCIGLPDGRVFTKVDGSYTEKIALDSQSGKWNYTLALGSANALAATLEPKLINIVEGLSIWIKIKTSNTGVATLNLNSFGEKPIIYHETGEPLVGGDFQAGDVVNLVYDGTSWRLQPSLAYMDKRYTKLTAPPQTTFYVVGSSGNDSNTGISIAEGFATIQGAVNSICSKYMTSDTITLIISAGTFAPIALGSSYVAQWVFIGAGVTKTKIDASSISTTSGRAISVSNTTLTVKNLSMSAYYECLDASAGGVIEVDTAGFNMAGNSSTGISCASGTIRVYGNIDFSGSGRACIYSTGLVRLGYKDDISTRAVAFVWAPNTNVTSGNVVATNGGRVEVFSSSVYQSGYPTGRKYVASLNGVINTSGAGAGFFAGTTDGVTSYGGQYA